MFGLFKKASPTQLSTQLLAACKAGQLEEVKKIITKGVDVGRRNDHGKTALMYAAENGMPYRIVCRKEVVKRVVLQKFLSSSK